MSDGALPLCACEQYYDSHHPECPARRAYEALASRLETYQTALAQIAAFIEQQRQSVENRVVERPEPLCGIKGCDLPRNHDGWCNHFVSDAPDNVFHLSREALSDE